MRHFEAYDLSLGNPIWDSPVQCLNRQRDPVIQVTIGEWIGVGPREQPPLYCSSLIHRVEFFNSSFYTSLFGNGRWSSHRFLCRRQQGKTASHQSLDSQFPVDHLPRWFLCIWRSFWIMPRVLNTFAEGTRKMNTLCSYFSTKPNTDLRPSRKLSIRSNYFESNAYSTILSSLDQWSVSLLLLEKGSH